MTRLPTQFALEGNNRYERACSTPTVSWTDSYQVGCNVRNFANSNTHEGEQRDTRRTPTKEKKGNERKIEENVQKKERENRKNKAKDRDKKENRKRKREMRKNIINKSKKEWKK